MNYTIITDEQALRDFIAWLPELGPSECFYLCLFARSKYAKNDDGSNKFPHIKTDKAQLKRFTVTRKKNMIDKIRQLEVAVGAYRTKDGEPIPQEALALYITPGPRDMRKAMFILMKALIDIQMCQGENFNIHAEALSAIQKARSKRIYVDFDIDCFNPYQADMIINNGFDTACINKEAVTFLRTRGGVHVLVDPRKVDKHLGKIWYKYLHATLRPDVRGDNMIPVPGTYQGGFTPILYPAPKKERLPKFDYPEPPF